MNKTYKNYFYYDNFLSKVIKKDCFVLKKTNSFYKSAKNRKTIKKFIQLYNNDKIFIHLKLTTYDKSIDSFLKKNNFKLIEKNEIYEKKRKKCEILKKVKFLNIRYAKQNDKKNISNIAKKNFKLSRFHKDELISNYYSNKIKKKWAENYFVGKRGDALIVAEIKKTVVGFLLLITLKKQIVIDLICVDKNYSGQGIGKAMINYLEENNSFESIIVGTQSDNNPSKILYKNYGFKIKKTNFTYHYHN